MQGGPPTPPAHCLHTKWLWAWWRGGQVPPHPPPYMPPPSREVYYGGITCCWRVLSADLSGVQRYLSWPWPAEIPSLPPDHLQPLHGDSSTVLRPSRKTAGPSLFSCLSHCVDGPLPRAQRKGTVTGSKSSYSSVCHHEKRLDGANFNNSALACIIAYQMLKFIWLEKLFSFTLTT